MGSCGAVAMSAHSHADHDHGPGHPHEAHAPHEGHDHEPKAAAVDDCSNCAAHRPRPAGEAARWGWLSGLVPILACAVCPVCLSAYATILSAFGVGFAISEGQHAILLIV